MRGSVRLTSQEGRIAMSKIEGRSGKSLTLYLPDELADRLEASAERNHRTKRMQVILALQEYLTKDEGQFGIGPPSNSIGKQKTRKK
jgi:hypothetical protein